MVAAFMAAAAGLHATGASAASEPGCRLSSFLDAAGIEPAPLPAPRVSEGWAPIRQAEWGWWPWRNRQDEEIPPEEEAAPEEEEEIAAGPAFGEQVRRGGGAWARKTRIGLEFGAFLPFGAKEESFGSGQMGGVFLGFGLPPLVGDLVVTNEVRLLEGTTSSRDQSSGHDVSSLVIAVKDDFLVHFFPDSQAFNVHWFLGASLGIESTTARRGSAESTETDVWFLADTGIGVWLNLAGPLDVVARLELDYIPTTKNVPFFFVGMLGLQARF
jgi:hypothetical protein